MVQKKVTKKPGNGIQGEHLIPEKLGNGSNKGIKMKISRSIKLSDVEGLKPSSSSSSSPLRKSIAQPGKPPAATTPQKKSMIKVVDGSPNYMKSTSSSKAKKESSKVSSRTSLTGLNSKNLHRRSSGSKTSSGSCNKPASARTLTRTSSFKLVRTLRKSPSFKLARASAKKSSCADMNNVHGDTCSSTLKDSKFPPYLMLNHGTESEGTSVIKVCPYTYCSLNDHHRTPLPPLKCFLKAKRRSMKTQKSMKMEALSPRRLKPSGYGTVHTSIGVDLDNTPSPLMEEEPMDLLFIEIYAHNKGNDAEATKGSTKINSEGTDGSESGNETAVQHYIDTLVSESLSEGSPRSEMDFDENFQLCGEIISEVDEDITGTLHEELKQNDVDEESSPWNLTEGDKQEHSVFEVIDIEWDEWQFSASEPSYESHSSMESDVNTADSSESDKFLISSDERDSYIVKEVAADGAEKIVEEDLECTDTCSQVSETLCYNQVPSTEEMFQVLLGVMEEENEEERFKTGSVGIFTIESSSRKELHEEPTSGKEKLMENRVPEAVNDVSEALEVPKAVNDVSEALEVPESVNDVSEALEVPESVNDVSEALEVPENSCTIDLKGDAFESTRQFQLHSFIKTERNEINEDYNVIQKPANSEADQTVAISDFCPESKLSSGEMEAEKVADAELLIGNHDSSHKNAHVVDNPTALEKDQDEAEFKVPTSMVHKTSLAESSEEVGKVELEDNATDGLDVAETFPAAESNKTSHKPRSKSSFTRSNAKEELPDNHNNRKWTIGHKINEENYEEEKNFNPREPNFLPIVPEPEAEKVDLKYQMMDERKNAEDWMLDHALRQAVSKLAPDRKRKVALLVEAFETILPITKCETHLRHTSTGFAQGHIQACK